MKRCENGHALAGGASECGVCGARAARRLRSSDAKQTRQLKRQALAETQQLHREKNERWRSREESERTAAESVAARALMLDCPHCGAAKSVTRRLVEQKQGISGGKAAGGLVTGGWSLFVTGLSRKQIVNQLECASCGMLWHVA